MQDADQDWLQEDGNSHRKLSFYRFDAPYDREGADLTEEAPEISEEAEVYEEDEDEDDLFAALDAALDQLEHEERVEEFRPREDSLEVKPGYSFVYRRYLEEFICTDAVHDAPMDFAPRGHVPRDLAAQFEHERLLARYRRDRSRVDHWQDILHKKGSRAA